MCRSKLMLNQFTVNTLLLTKTHAIITAKTLSQANKSVSLQSSLPNLESSTLTVIPPKKPYYDYQTCKLTPILIVVLLQQHQRYCAAVTIIKQCCQ